MVLNKDFGAVLQMDLAIFGASQVHVMVNGLVIVVLVWSGEGRWESKPPSFHCLSLASSL